MNGDSVQSAAPLVASGAAAAVNIEALNKLSELQTINQAQSRHIRLLWNVIQHYHDHTFIMQMIH